MCGEISIDNTMLSLICWRWGNSRR